MGEKRDDAKREYEELRARFKGTSLHEFRQGGWFVEFVRWLLESYAKQVDSKYIRRKYPGLGPANQAKKAIGLACKFNAIAGGLSAGAVTAAEVVTIGGVGLPAPVTVPTIAAAIAADVAYSTRTQLRATYDLSVIHGAPLSVDDVEDCYLVFISSLGIRLGELGSGVLRPVGTKVLRYNIRKLLRAGLHKSIQKAVQKIGGSELAKRLTQRAILRVAVPGVSIPISATANYFFTRSILRTANVQMLRRGRAVQPLIRLYTRCPELPKTTALKALIAVVDTGDPEGWGDHQMDVLRHCQGFLSLSDDELAEMETYFDREVDGVLAELPTDDKKAMGDLLELTCVGAALAPDRRHDDAYAEAIARLSGTTERPLTDGTALRMVRDYRRKLG